MTPLTGGTTIMMKRKISGKTTITEPGEYTLTGDIERGNGTRISGTCIEIRASDVVLDGDGHTVDGWGISDTTGIGVAGDGTLRNVTVKNLTLTDWNRGVSFSNVRNARVRNVEATENSYGMWFENVTGASVENSTATGNLIGVGFGLHSEDGGVTDSRIEKNHVNDVFEQTGCVE